MAKNFVFNFGYDTSHVTSVLGAEKVEEGSDIVLIVPEESDERQERAIKEVSRYVKELSKDISVEVFPVSEDFETRFLQIKNILKRLENVILSLSGGSRDVLVPLCIVASTSPDLIENTYFRSDIDSELEKVNLPSFREPPNETEKEIINAMEDDYYSISELEEVTKFSSSTLYRNIKNLKQKNLVKEEKEDKKLYRTTISARMLKT
ncbi:MAG: CRISPR-associated CARF protein Csa3 [Candidatus Nanohaloarchaea archaeon]